MISSVFPSFFGPALLPHFGELVVPDVSLQDDRMAAESLAILVTGFHHDPRRGFSAGGGIRGPVPTPPQQRLLVELRMKPVVFRQKMVEWLVQRRQSQNIPALKAFEFRDLPSFAERAFHQSLRETWVLDTETVLDGYQRLSIGITVPGIVSPRMRDAVFYLRMLERAAGMSSKEVAEKTDIPLKLYRYYRQGKQRISHGHLQILASFFQANLSDMERLYGGNIRASDGLLSMPGGVKPKAAALANVLRTIAVENYHSVITDFAEDCGISGSDLRRLMIGSVIVPGERSPRNMKDTLVMYLKLQRFLQTKYPAEAVVFDAALKEAYLEEKEWLNHADWFAEKKSLAEFFREGRRQFLLEKSGNAFKKQEDMDPREKIGLKVIDWWMEYNDGSLTGDFLHAESVQRLVGAGKDSFVHLVFSGKPPPEMEAMRRMAKAIGPDLMELWFLWRMQELRKKFARNTAGSPVHPEIETIFEIVLPYWVRFNGGYQSHNHELVVPAFGVQQKVLVQLTRGCFAVERGTVCNLAMYVEGLPAERVERHSKIFRAWCRLNGIAVI